MELTEVRQEVFPLDDGLHRLMQYDSNGTFVDSYLIIGSTQALAVDLQRAKGPISRLLWSLRMDIMTIWVPIQENLWTTAFPSGYLLRNTKRSEARFPLCWGTGRIRPSVF